MNQELQMQILDLQSKLQVRTKTVEELQEDLKSKM